jgi:hypothetical protein
LLLLLLLLPLLPGGVDLCCSLAQPLQFQQHDATAAVAL